MKDESGDDIALLSGKPYFSEEQQVGDGEQRDRSRREGKRSDRARLNRQQNRS